MNPRALAVVASLALLAGCGGGGGGSSTTPQQPITQPTQTPVTSQSATVNILVPRTSTSSSARVPQFVSPNAATLTVTVLTVNGSAPTAAQVPPSQNPVTAQLTTGSGGNCTAVTGGLSCAVTVPAPTGAVKYSFQLKDASSNLLAINTVTFTVTTGNQTFSTQLNGIVKAVTVTAPALNAGKSLSDAPITVAAFDASGAQIVGSAPYANPFTLTDNDKSGHTSLVNGSTTGLSVVVSAPTDAVGLNFDGSNQTSTFQITASGGTQAGTAAVSGGGTVTVATFTASSTSSISFTTANSADATSTTTVAMPSAGGFSGSEIFTNPFSPVSGTLDQTLTNVTPSGVSQSFARAPQSTRTAQTIPPGAFVLLYYQEKFDHTVQFPAAPTFSFHIPAGVVPSGSAFYVGYYDTTTGQWNDTFEGPITVSGTTVTFVSNGKPFTFLANVTYTFRLIYFPPGVPTPAPSASPAPIALTGTTPDDAAHGGKSTDPNFNQPTLFFVVPNQTQSFTASQTGTSSFVLGLDPTSCGTGASAIVSFTTSDSKTFSVTSSAHDGFCKGLVTGAEGTGATVWFTNTSATLGNN